MLVLATRTDPPAAWPKAAPGNRAADAHNRVRRDRIFGIGNVTLRTGGCLTTSAWAAPTPEPRSWFHPGPRFRVLTAATGELLRELILDPTRDYQPTGARPGPKKEHTPDLTKVRGVLDVLRHHTSSGGRI